MADVVQEKSRGLKFAEQQLLRHGWEHGKGLGRAENGISEAIKVKVKSDKGGVGHKEGEQFTFHWWDHVFNKASSSLQVESAPNGIQVKKTAEEDEDEEDGMISNKKPRKAALAKAKLYGCFVKSATLLCGEEQPEPKSSISDDSSDEEEDQKLDLSSAIKLSDADLMKACGGRTAHKGARHGLTMSAKLARLEQQEAEFMAKYGKKSQPTSASPVCVAPTPPPSQSAGQRAERQEEVAEDSQRKKKKKSTDGANEPVGDEMPESAETGVKAKKKKQKAREEIPDVVSSTEDSFIFVKKAEVQFPKKKRKHKKRKNADQTEEEDESRPSAVAESPEETTELHADTKVKKKKKKKSSKKHSEAAEEEESNDKESGQSEPAQDCVAAPGASEEAEVTEQGSSVKPKRKKCKKNKPSVGDLINEEALPPKKKKKKSRE